MVNRLGRFVMLLLLSNQYIFDCCKLIRFTTTFFLHTLFYILGSTLGSVKSCCHRCGTRSTLSTNNNNNNNDETNSTLNGSEPVYQGIVERDISVIRKETEITSLKSELAKLKTELSSSQKQVFTLEDSEKMLRERLADEKHRSLTLEKMASIQKQKVN